MGDSLEKESDLILQRFQKIHDCFIEHSQRESQLIERRHGFKPLDIDPLTLTKDYTNKAMIIGNIDNIIHQLLYDRRLRLSEYNEVVENKFQ